VLAFGEVTAGRDQDLVRLGGARGLGAGLTGSDTGDPAPSDADDGRTGDSAKAGAAEQAPRTRFPAPSDASDDQRPCVGGDATRSP